ncbi:hypothetical protein [Arthrospira platensis]|uniref:Uncharacterized protein n=1 Tax=Limnospira platensis NIES-46 TaxID=1236695 RepID=A0A5M3T7Y4_LIMPL|nr:hypothetical protein [Arthrospira platensis]KDR56741.1 hypothetical protein APPUASWS_014745 [Arthrospira platensis str. Paraca]MBD2671591.1 hypothetical protein [Arthrospira platensis FACHB-439]MBD2712520.1 hypothetical protein [Arthrospira platensis FACHB-835]MDF2213356.1 hypothetical protein [Arthrospira platensis NCB002]QQW27287.1 hypothetical protein AP9108_18610 [Arthrospira sp. PCC 9108]BAI91669.1 hypothetical protein NIES39_K00190 [Arthrospira platensis NIES-39]
MTLAELKANAIASTLNPPIANNHPVPINPSRVSQKYKTGHFCVQPVMDLKKNHKFLFWGVLPVPCGCNCYSKGVTRGTPRKNSACPLPVYLSPSVGQKNTRPGAIGGW